ncbi:MAG: 2'-5' RNA ligase family protein, partial [Halorhodospira sp.]
MSGKQRLFFALWSPACLADALSDLQSELGCAGRPVARGRLHMTLLFVGVGERARVAEAGAQAAARAE